MRKLIIFCLALTLFTACKNNKKDTKEDGRIESDDYRNNDETKEAKSTEYKDDNKSQEKEKENRGSEWTSSHVKEFVDNCVSEAVSSGEVLRSKAIEYCECMQRTLEIKYPNPIDVGNLDIESAEMKEKMKACLGM